jgi:hypothetical protein
MVQPTLQISQSRRNASNHLRQDIIVKLFYQAAVAVASFVAGLSEAYTESSNQPSTKKTSNPHKDNALSWIDCTLRVWLFLPGFLHP